MYNTRMVLYKTRRVFGVLLLLLSMVFLTWGLRSGEYLVQSTELASSDMALPGSEQATGSSSGSITAALAPEPRSLELSWPKSLRLGDDGTLRLTVSLSSGSSGSSTGDQTPPGIYESYNLVMQSHLDLPGIERNPTGEVSQAMLPGQPVVFLWYLRPSTPGVFSGKVWLHMRFVPRSAGQEQRILLAAQQVDIEVVTRLGMSGNQARLYGSLGLVAGALLGLDGVLGWCLEQLAQHKKG